MSSTRTPQASQESLLAVSDRTGQFIERRLYDLPDGAVDVIEQKLHLMSCLGQMAAESMREGMLWADKSAISSRYGGRTAAVMAGVATEKERFATQAKWSFAHAFGQFTLVDSGMINRPKVAEAYTKTIFKDFRKLYYGNRNYKESQTYLRTLGEQVDNLQTAVSLYNRDNKLRPHKLEPPKKGEPEKTEPERLLDSRQRAEAILFDPRAGFIPTNNREKTTIMSFLDYFDNPEYPLGINNQLFEVVCKHQNLGYGSALGMRGAESITWEMGDYLADAAKSFRLLTELKEAMAGVSPNVTLAQEFGTDVEAVTYLLRYGSQAKWVKSGDQGGLPDVLRAKEFRWIPKGTFDPTAGKRKTVHSQFTSPDRSTAFQHYLQEKTESTTIRQAIKLVDAAIPNELSRARLEWRSLNDIAGIPEYQATTPVNRAALASLEAVKDEPVIQLITDEQLSHVT